MADIIHLLPDSVANQIAAGEVVQRPASAVKELLENTIDAGATEVTLVIREAGKILIQVTDNGCGMSERDARMCFERHATSKIEKSDDLLRIRTLGFRGEALASIASIAQVELKTRRHEDEIGTCVIIEGSEFRDQFPVACSPGTSISIKNLFFNVPARRNFLKSNTLELKHIIEEFFRVALVNPDVSFNFYNQDKILFKVAPGNLKQRISHLFGTPVSQKLIPLEQHTDLVNISGFIGKPEYARKIRGEQYFFTNGRYMRNPHLHYAVADAFRELIPDDAYPLYFIYLEVDPQTIDVNIHPTKTEINFQDSKSIFAILHAAVKQSIGRFNISPSIDFDVETSLNISELRPGQAIVPPTIKINESYNPFEKRTEPQSRLNFPNPSPSQIRGWGDFFSSSPATDPLMKVNPSDHPDLMHDEALQGTPAREKKVSVQIQKSFIVTHTISGIVLIDQQHAHERILFEKFSEDISKQEHSGQPRLFPETIQLSHDNAALYHEWQNHFAELGFEISDLGNGTFVIQSFPMGIMPGDPVQFFESVLEGLKSPGNDSKSSHKQLLAKTMALKLAVKRGRTLHQEEIDALVENLFACKVPDLSPEGKPTMILLGYDDLYKKFKIYG